MNRTTRREFLKLLGGAGAGLIAGPALSAADAIFANAAEDYKIATRGGFVRFKEPGLLQVRATSLSPSFKIMPGKSSPERIRFELINVRAGQLQIDCEQLKNINKTDTRIEAELLLDGPGNIILSSSYAPLPGERLNFITFSDTHLGDPEAEEHFARVRNHTNLRAPLFAIDAGDNIDVDEQKQWDVFVERTAELKMPLFSTIGNHDSYLDTKLYKKHLGDLYYSFIIHDTQFLLLDNAQKYNNATLTMDGSKPQAQWNWLDGELKKPAKHRVAFFHFPVYGKRSMMDPMYIPRTSFEVREQEVERMMTMFKESGVEYICHGHIHSPERKVIDGITHLRLGGGGGSRPSHTNDSAVGFAHIFVDNKGIRDYTIHMYYEKSEIEKIEFCEPRNTIPAGSQEPIIVNGIAKDARLLGIEPELKITSGPGKLNGWILDADKPGTTRIAATYEGFRIEQQIQIT
ncbi:MAG TPA: metallophosphoesterase [bacterium]|nr:metallophosphoesterase [bacterium]